jgi:ribokinase
MRKIYIMGSINMDLVIETDVFPESGETVIGKNFYNTPGGKGANQASTIGKLGGSVSFLGCVGKDSYGKKLRSQLKRNGLKTNNLLDKKEHSGIALITLFKKDNRIILSPGANYSIEKEDVDSFLNDAEFGDIFLTQFETNPDAIQYSIKCAKEKGMFVVLNPAPFVDGFDSIYSLVDLIILNENEASQMTNVSFDSKNKIKEATRKIHLLGIPHIIITVGKEGLYVSNHGFYHLEAIPTEVIDTTCAGDSFIGGLILGIAQHKELREAVIFGMQIASITISKKGSQIALPSYDEYKKKFSVKQNK